MRDERLRSSLTTNVLALAGIVLAAFYWVFESVIEAVLFREGTFTERLLPVSEPYELWHRSVITALLIGLGIFAQYLFNKRRRAEESLRESEERFRGLAEATFEGVAISENGRVLETNRAFAELFGYERHEVVGMNVLDFVAPESHELVQQRISSLSKEPYEAVGLKKGGRHFEIEVHGKTASYRGRIVRVTAVRDISERKETERRLLEAEERYRTLVEQVPAVIYINPLSETEPSTYVSPRVEELVGYSVEESKRDPELWDRLLHPDDRERVTAEEARTNATGEPFKMEYRMIARDGRVVWVRDEAMLVRDEEGRPRFWQGVMFDISERKEAEEKLRRAEERYRTLVERMPAVTYIQEIGSPDAAMYMSPQIETLTGYTPEDCKDPDLRWRMVHPDDRERMQSEDERTGEPGEVFTTEYRVVRRDGRIVWVRNEAVMVEEASGSRYWQGFMVDITERKRAEEEMHKAREAAEAANRAKSEFLANMSHEIRTPMNGVIGMTELLLNTGLDSEQREYAEAIRLSGENLMVIINDILDFSKIEAGAMHLETIDFDLRSTVEDVVALLAGRAHDKGIELASLIEYDVPTALRGDPVRLKQVLINLVGNAIKFTEEGEVVVKAGLAEERPGGVAMIRFEVRDTGIGMTPEQRGRLFESFTQADASTTRRYGGTGLGLAISKQLVEIMGGEIGADSEQGVGSTFFFTVPFEKQSVGMVSAPRLLADLGDLRALIVDDNATNRRILREQLSSWGMEAGEVEGGRRALEELRCAARNGEPHDLAILDMQMPEMDGMELAKRIKADPDLSATRLVLLTSVGRRGEGEEARQAGVEAYLTKPVKQSELYDCLATVMGGPDEASDQTHLVTRHSLRERRAFGRGQVLVAEDNPVNQKVAARMLENLGYRVDVANDGLEALEALSRTHYGAVLMDVQMPEMDGYEATKKIREREGSGGPRTPIIAMTANAMQGDREKALEAGMDDYVPKPIKPEELEAILKRWIPQETPEPDASSAAPDDGARSGTEGPLDQGVLTGLRELGDADLLSELVGMFLEDASSRLGGLREAVKGDDARSVERIAHTLKGSSGNMGANRMAALCAELQDLGASGNLERAPALLVRLEEEFGRVRPALEAAIAGG